MKRKQRKAEKKHEFWTKSKNAKKWKNGKTKILPKPNDAKINQNVDNKCTLRPNSNQNNQKTCFRSKTLLNPSVQFWSVRDPGTFFPILIFDLWTIWRRQSIELDLSSPEHFFWLNLSFDSVPNGLICFHSFSAFSFNFCWFKFTSSACCWSRARNLASSANINSVRCLKIKKNIK